MKTFIALLVASIALVVPAVANADGGEIDLSTQQGVLHYEVDGIPETANRREFDFSIVVPFHDNLVAAYNDDLRNRGPGWEQFRVRFTACTRIEFSIPAPLPFGDTGWHCTESFSGTPTNNTFTTGLNMLATDIVPYVGWGRECALMTDPPGASQCLTPGAEPLPHPFHFAEVTLDNYIGQGIPGSLYANVHADLVNGDGSVAIGLGDAGTITAIGGGTGQSFATFGTSGTTSSPLVAPKSFLLETTKTVSVPDRLRGKTIPQARQRLARFLLKVGGVRYARSKLVKRGRVIRPLIRPGTKIVSGSRVPLLVSRGR